MENDSEPNPEMELDAPGFHSTIELQDSKSFDHAVQLLHTLKQREHGESLDLEPEADSSESEIISSVEDSLDEIRDSVERLSDRTSQLEKQVESGPERREVIDSSRIDELENTLQEVADKTETLEKSVSEIQQPEPETEESDEPVESSTDESEDIECPQCGAEFDSVRSLSSHTSRSQDHTTIAEYFRNKDQDLECPECSHESEDSDSFSVHFREDHGTTMVQYYLDHFDNLTAEESESEAAPEKSDEDVETDEEEEAATEEEEEFDADTVPDLIEEGIVEPEPPYTYNQFKQLDKIEQAAALYLAGKEIREGDTKDYADKLLTADVSSTQDKEAQYIYRLLTSGMAQYFENKSEETTFGREKTLYRLEDALPDGVEELQIQDRSADELDELPDTAVSEIVLEALNELQSATLGQVQDYVYADGEDANHKIKRVLNNYLAGMISIQRDGNEKKYSLKPEVEEKLEDDYLSFYQATQKKISGRSQYVCEDCGKAFESSSDAKKHRRDSGHLNWDRRSHLPWRGNNRKEKVRAQA